MQTLPFSTESLAEAVAIIKRGGVIAHATETCYGLACDLTNMEAVEKLFHIKQRPVNQSVSALFASVEQAKQCVEWNERAEVLAKKYLPGPLTLILPIRHDARFIIFPSPSLNPSPTLGVRISPHEHAALLSLTCPCPISTTSANLHGKPNPYSADDIVGQFGEAKHQPDLILDSGVLPQKPPSTVIDLTKEDGPKTVRSGEVRL